jgi:hypothetical protein
LGKLERIFSYVSTAVAELRKYADFVLVEVRMEGRGKGVARAKYSPPPEKYRSAARLFLLQEPQVGISEGSLKGLATDTRR